jgi:hypothetical protein
MNNQSIFKTILIILIALITAPAIFAQKVANYAVGKMSTEAYEHFSFWAEAGKRTKITYTYGKDNKELNAAYLGKSNYKGKPCFKVTLPNRQMLYVILSGNKLFVTNAAKTYNKTFAWEYEGPVNGIGNYCDVCTQDEKEAMTLLRKYYLK